MKQIGYGASSFVCTDGKFAYKYMKMNNLDNWLRDVLFTKYLSHPNIIRQHNILSKDSKIIIKTKLYNQLSHIDFSKIDDNFINLFIYGICSALQYLHDNNIAHRDVKEDNIVFTSDRFILIDLGLSKPICDGSSENALTPNTTTYSHRAPETRSNNYTCSIDIWSFGITLFYMVTGYPLYHIFYKKEFKSKRINDLMLNFLVDGCYEYNRQPIDEAQFRYFVASDCFVDVVVDWVKKYGLRGIDLDLYLDIIKKCINREQRPTPKDIIHMIQKEYFESRITIKLYIIPDSIKRYCERNVMVVYNDLPPLITKKFTEFLYVVLNSNINVSIELIFSVLILVEFLYSSKYIAYRYAKKKIDIKKISESLYTLLTTTDFCLNINV